MKRRSLAAGLFSITLTGNAAAQESDSSSAVCKCVQMEDRDGVTLLSGTGQRLSEAIELEAGTYRLEVETDPVDEDDDIVQVLLFRSGNVNMYGNSDFTLNAYISLENPVASTAMPLETGGSYVVEVNLLKGSWKVGISPF